MSTSDFKWFGEGFDGFPKSLPENCVEYNVYLISPDTDQLQRKTVLQNIQRSIAKLEKKHLTNYIWQKDAFDLKLASDDSAETFLSGRTNFGDSVEDEWLITFLVREISKEFAEVWVQIRDSDGEFLLIEGANSLPHWVNPEVAENRVWIHDGKLQLISLSQSAQTALVDAAKRPLTIKEALLTLKTKSHPLFHSKELDEEAFYRVNKYPGQIADNFHHSLLPLPRPLASIVHEVPQSINLAVEAFYLRDPISLAIFDGKSDSDESSKNLHFPPTDLVELSVKFPKVGFAQIKSQEFEPPSVWSNFFSKGSSPASDVSRLETAMKVTCGFEMALRDPKGVQPGVAADFQQRAKELREDPSRLASDNKIATWSRVNDSEDWLNINFEDFERQLAGNQGRDRVVEVQDSSFGHKSAEENLRKMVKRFEDFLNDDAAGLEGAEMKDDMDFDDDESDEVASSDGEAKDESFNEQEFAQMMREMMGMPPLADEVKDSEATRTRNTDKPEKSGEDDEINAEEIREIMRQMEAELNESGALNLNPTPNKIRATKSASRRQGKDHKSDLQKGGKDEESDDEDTDVELVRNMLESFKSQEGMSGPGGNLMKLMGIQMPRDADDSRPP